MQGSMAIWLCRPAFSLPRAGPPALFEGINRHVLLPAFFCSLPRRRTGMGKRRLSIKNAAFLLLQRRSKKSSKPFSDLLLSADGGYPAFSRSADSPPFLFVKVFWMKALYMDRFHHLLKIVLLKIAVHAKDFIIYA